ncbi:hypothetical protein MKW92_017417 [Papaver armeniacum]|nr:hypothetical protein MKW92_017417 [Papaver armeniacum]
MANSIQILDFSVLEVISGASCNYFYSYLSSTFSLDFHPSHDATKMGLLLKTLGLENGVPTGCFWTDSCPNKWFRGCGAGHMLIDHSDECNGLCPEPEHNPCLSFYTPFHCCNSVMSMYVVWTARIYPSITDKTTGVGYWRTGVELAVQQKSGETFKFASGPWMPCSSPCYGGIQYRDVKCYSELAILPNMPCQTQPNRVSHVSCWNDIHELHSLLSL